MASQTAGGACLFIPLATASGSVIRPALQLLFCAALLVSFTGVAGAQAPQTGLTPLQASSATAKPPVATDHYRIGPGDILDIRVFNRPNLSRDSVRVESNGTIRMPLIDGEVPAACKSEGELANDLAARYLKYYRRPQVDVFIKEYHAREVALIGAVNEQGRYQMQRRVRLLELLTFAKGPSDKAGRNINIVRESRPDQCEGPSQDGGLIALRLDATLRGEEQANPYVQAGDIITVPEADQVYVIGNVYSPKSIPMREPITVSRAIAMAGGALRDSKTEHVRIVRQATGSGTQAEMFVNLKLISKKQAEDVLLQPNDIVEIPESTGRSMLRGLVGAVGPAAAQLPIHAIP